MPRENMFDEYEQMCEFLAASGVPARLHVLIVDGMTALTIGAALLNENAAHYTKSGDGPTPDPDRHPALQRALTAIGQASADELFETLLRNYLDGVLDQLPGQPPRTTTRREAKATRRHRESPGR